MKKILPAILVLAILLLSTLCVQANREIDLNKGKEEYINLAITEGNGKCGDSMTWNLDKNGMLTFSGTWTMYDYSDYENQAIKFPWLEKNVAEAITGVKINDGIESMADFALFGTSIESVILPDSVKHVGISSFANCKKLKSVILSNNILCNSLAEIALPQSVVNIDMRSFANCKTLSAIVIPASVTIIRERSFQNNMSLKQLVLPSGIEKIEECAFSGSSNIEK